MCNYESKAELTNKQKNQTGKLKKINKKDIRNPCGVQNVIFKPNIAEEIVVKLY